MLCLETVPRVHRIHIQSRRGNGTPPYPSWFEDNTHLFLRCDKILWCWVQANFLSQISHHITQEENFWNIFFVIWETLAATEQLAWVMVLWSIWRSKNLKAWETTEQTIATIVHRSLPELLKENEGNLAPKPTIRAIGSWVKLLRVFTKCNVDTFFQQIQQNGNWYMP